MRADLLAGSAAASRSLVMPQQHNIITTMSNTLHVDTPEVRAIVSRAFPEYNGKRFRVEIFQGPMRLDSYWSGGSRDYWTAVRLNDGATATVPENGTPWNPTLEQVEQLPENTALVQYHAGNFEYVTVYVRPESINHLMLPAPVELSRDEKIVLSATRCFKSSYAGIKNYRFSEANQSTGISLEAWDAAKASLIGKGLLNKAGAITDQGRNAIGDARITDEALRSPKGWASAEGGAQ